MTDQPLDPMAVGCPTCRSRPGDDCLDALRVHTARVREAARIRAIDVAVRRHQRERWVRHGR